MPQLDFSTYASQIFWLSVTFGLLYIMMARFALPVVREVLQNRQTRITEDLIKAEKLKEEAESAEADFTSVITKSRDTASQMLNVVRTNAAKEAEKRHAKLDETFARQAKEADSRIEIIKKETTEALTPVTVSVASDMLEKLIGVKVDKKNIEKTAANVSSN